MRRLFVLVSALAVTLFMVGLAGGASPALADYGNTAQYQIEISGNIPGHQGGGIWLWIELSSDGTGTYQGSDCGHAGQGAAHDSGDIKWVNNGNGTLTIKGVVLNGLPFLPPINITVPSSYGHKNVDFASLFPVVSGALGIPSGAGFAQVQVAP